MNFAAALFDMDGLLIDSERATMQAWIRAAEDNGSALAPADYLAVVGRAAADSRTILTTLLGSSVAYARVAAQVAHMLSAAPRFPLKAGVRELLSALRAAGVPCAVASSTGAKEINHRLLGAGVLEFFGGIAGGDEVVRGKPDPAVYLLAAQRIGVPANRSLAFEDSEHGARAALAAGAQVVVVPDLKVPAAVISEHGLRVLRSLHEAIESVPDWFGTRLPP